MLGADSTSTVFVPAPGQPGSGHEHHLNFGQKVFQVGRAGTLGITMWGLGGLADTSYRTLIATFGDSLVGQPAVSMQDAAVRWSDHFWASYSSLLAPLLQRSQQLLSISQRSQAEDRELEFLKQTFSGGFCLGGICLPDRTPQAFEVTYSPIMNRSPVPRAISIGTSRFWGCPNLIYRLLFGIDDELYQQILHSGRWQGTDQDLVDLIQPHCLGQPQNLPIREAIDWVHASIYATIKVMKFSHLAPVCGGPIEVAVITSDRDFRWVRHKALDAAIAHDGFSHA